MYNLFFNLILIYLIYYYYCLLILHNNVNEIPFYINTESIYIESPYEKMKLQLMSI